MKRILEFDDFVSNLSLSEIEQAEIKDFVKKYEKYMSFHDAGEFNKSLDDIVNDVIWCTLITLHLKKMTFRITYRDYKPCQTVFL